MTVSVFAVVNMLDGELQGDSVGKVERDDLGQLASTALPGSWYWSNRAGVGGKI